MSALSAPSWAFDALIAQCHHLSWVQVLSPSAWVFMSPFSSCAGRASSPWPVNCNSCLKQMALAHLTVRGHANTMGLSVVGMTRPKYPPDGISSLGVAKARRSVLLNGHCASINSKDAWRSRLSQPRTCKALFRRHSRALFSYCGRIPDWSLGEEPYRRGQM